MLRDYYTDQVVSAAWAPGGRFLASGFWDGTVRIWGLLRVEHMLQVLEQQLPLHSWTMFTKEA